MKIILLDDHKIFGESLKLLLEEREEIELVEYVSDIETFFESLDKSTYDICTIDINLKGKSTGLELIKKVKSYNDEIKIIILTSYDLINYKDLAYKYGASDFINKSVEVDELVKRILNVYKGKNNINKESIVDGLTKREIEILKELARGKSKKETAKDLYISERTLYNHISNIYEKLGINNTVKAINKAREIGYIDGF